MSSAPDLTQCVILAGGLGTRLRPLVADRPKSLVPVGGTPFLEIVLRLLARQGFGRFLLCTGYLSDMVRETFGDGQSLGVSIDYSDEGLRKLGTAGALRHALPLLEEQFLVLNGDTYLVINYADLLAAHAQATLPAGGVMTMALADSGDTAQSGNVVLDGAGRVMRFAEKDAVKTGDKLWLNAGAYVMERLLIEDLGAGQRLSLERDVLPAVIARDASIFGWPASARFFDIGTPESLENFRNFYQSGAISAAGA